MMAAGSRSGYACDYYGNCYRRGNDNGALMAGGMLSIVGGLIVGSVLLLQSDQARIDVVPLSATPVVKREDPKFAVGFDPAPQGGVLQLRF